MKNFRVRSPFNYVPVEGTTFTMPSETIPDQNLSMREILDRYARGLDVGGVFEGIYEEDEAPSRGINPRTLDLVDLQDMREENAELIQTLEKEAKEQAKEAEKNRKKRKLEELKKLQQELEESTASPNNP